MHPDLRCFSIRSLFIIALTIQSLISSAQVSRPQEFLRPFGSDPIVGDPRTNRSLTVAALRARKDTTGKDSVVRFIVKLRTSPNTKNSAGRVATVSQIELEHSDFLSGLNQLSSSARASGEAKTIDVVHEYKRAFNGFALKANRSFLGAIRKMPHVISITEDKRVKANDETTNSVINVPNAWAAGTTGEGIVIGIIDTGIDYSHPDLGGGIGAGYKVIGGYDFINDDSDPKDDHGHGTHCAGIAAANGLIKGVAPDAKLMAIKVLDSYGNGSDSQVLAGIEYAIDPDGNPATDDAPDVCSMSLGRTPDAFEPMSEAVNNAVAQGIVFVIAAGNSYNYMTIGTPGIAEDAITVAAIDNSGATAIFSSRGPVQDSFILKPDVAAPGVAVNSTFLNSGYAELDGTSMATPHVAGTAALILGKNPGWSPAEVKGALMSTAHYDNDLKFIETGAGIVDAYAAATTNIVMSPGSISYGIPEAGTFKRTDVITVTNRGTSPQNIALEPEGMDGIDIQLTPSNFILNAGQTREVSVDINLTMSTLASGDVLGGHYGSVVLTAGSQKLKTILSLFNPVLSTFDYGDEIPSYVIISGGFNYFNPFTPGSTKLKAVLPEGTYDVFTWFNNGGVVVTEDFYVGTQSSSTTILSSAAKNIIDFNPVDKEGNPLTIGTAGVTQLDGPNLFSLTLGPMDYYMISDTRKYRLSWRAFIDPFDNQNLYEISLKCNDLTSSRVLSNDPDDFKLTTVTNPTYSEGTASQNFFYYAQSGGWTTWNSYPMQVQSPAKIHVGLDPQDPFLSFYKFFPAGESSGFAWETSRLDNDADLGLEYVSIWAAPIAPVDEDPFDFQLGKSLVNFTAYMVNDPQHIQLTNGNPFGAYNHHYGERLSGVVNWSLKNNGQQVSTGSFKNAMFDDFMATTMLDMDVPGGQNEMTLTWDSYYVGGRFSNVTTKLNFTSDPSVWEASPPQLTQFTLTSNGHVTNVLEEGDGGTIHLSATDLSAMSMTLEMKTFDTDDWQSMPLTGNGVYTGQIPSDILPGLYSLRVKVWDIGGNSVTHTLDPAFSVGDQPIVVPFTNVALISPINFDVNAGIDPLFTWSAIPRATYRFQLSASDKFEALLIDKTGLFEPTYTSASSLEKDSVYYWRVMANISGVDLPWSQVFTFKAAQLLPATLLSPADGAVDVPTYVELTWTPAAGAAWQTVEIATDEDFTQMYSTFSMPPDVGSTWFQGGSGTKVWWRVTTRYYFNSEYNIVSDAFSFRMEGAPGSDSGDPNNPIAGLEREPGVTASFPNPFADRAFVSFYSKADDEAKVTLTDGLGRIVRIEKYSLAKGDNILTIESEHENGRLTQGMYVLLIETASNQNHRVKLVRK